MTRESPLRIAVCLKRVPIPGARIAVTPDGQSVETAHLGFTMSPHEECAVEEAVRLSERVGGTTVAVTVGPPEAEEQLRYAISLGMDAALLVPTGPGDLDPQATARALVDAFTDLEARDGTVDVMLFGNESADAGGYQVGIRVAQALGRPIVNGVTHLEVGEDSLTATRPAGDVDEVYRLPLPAAVGVREGLNVPRYPTFRGRLASKKATVATHPHVPRPGGQQMVELIATADVATDTVILGQGPDAADRVVEVLADLEVIR